MRRVRRTDNGEWVEGEILRKNDGKCYLTIKNEGINIFTLTDIEVDIKSQIELTSFKDENDRLIGIGDKLKCQTYSNFRYMTVLGVINLKLNQDDSTRTKRELHLKVNGYKSIDDLFPEEIFLDKQDLKRSRIVSDYELESISDITCAWT